MKYVMFEDEHGQLCPVFFPDNMVHSMVKVEKPWTAISAGFFSMETGRCSGESTSLKLKSVKKRDTKWCLAAVTGHSALLIQLNVDRMLWKREKISQEQGVAAPAKTEGPTTCA